MRVLSTALLACALCVATSGVQAEEPAQESGIDELLLGEHWWGPEVSKEDFVGKVVLFEMWGS